RPVLAPTRGPSLPGGTGRAVVGRCRREQWLPAAPVETGAASGTGRPLRLGGSGVPLPDGGLEVESGGASAVRADQHELGGRAAAQPRSDAGVLAGDADADG